MLNQHFTNPLLRKNPTTIENLGICSALAVTLQVQNALIMSIMMIFVTCFSSSIISALRKFIPYNFRLVVQLTIIASLVILADLLLKAYFFEASKTLSVFIGLIITNCIILGRCESFALFNTPKLAFIDALGNGLGYAFALIFVASVREFFGNGSYLQIKILPTAYPKNLFILQPAGAFIIFGLIIWAQKTLISRKKNG
ncbi:MAG: Rnf-Nqr domain containing protein [Lentisphaeria bacterium]